VKSFNFLKGKGVVSLKEPQGKSLSGRCLARIEKKDNKFLFSRAGNTKNILACKTPLKGGFCPILAKGKEGGLDKSLLLKVLSREGRNVTLLQPKILTGNLENRSMGDRDYGGSCTVERGSSSGTGNRKKE